MMELTMLGSGSGGNAVAIRAGDAVLLVDAGFSAVELARRLEAAHLAPGQVTGVLISHEHDDHVRGLRVFAKRHGNLPVYANALTAERLQFQECAPEKLVIFNNGSPFAIGDFRIEPFSISHDAVDPVGFVICAGGRKVSVVTDIGYAGKMVPLKIRDSHIFVLESNHDTELLRNSERPAQLKHRILGKRGHLSNEHAAALLAQVLGPATRHLILAHLSEECNRPELVHRAMSRALAAMQRHDVKLQIARQDVVGETVAV